MRRADCHRRLLEGRGEHLRVIAISDVDGPGPVDVTDAVCLEVCDVDNAADAADVPSITVIVGLLVVAIAIGIAFVSAIAFLGAMASRQTHGCIDF